MSVDVDDPWAGDVDVTEMTAIDLEASREWSTKVSDPDRELHRLVATYCEHSGLDDWSMVCDRALRVELAYAIDAFEVSFSREDFDVRSTIPPLGWVEDSCNESSTETASEGSRELDEQAFERVSLVDASEVGGEDRWIGFSSPHVVKDMADRAQEEGAYESLTEMVRAGCERLLGRR